MIELIAFDADDTLWANETIYKQVEAHLCDMLADYGNKQEINDKLFATEMKNLPLYGYGIKSFGLSMIETAITISEQKIGNEVIAKILELINYMLTYELPVYEGVEETLQQLSKTYPLIVITKGDLLDQDMKVERSGLRQYFKGIEIVAKKEESTYVDIMEKYNVKAENFLMVGNSLRSDVLPVVSLGGIGVRYENSVAWAHEHDIDPAHTGLPYHSIHKLTELIPLIEELQG
jgi:putative hydrolase of the HAD superfamily